MSEEEAKEALLMLARKATVSLNQEIPYGCPGIGAVEIEGRMYQVAVHLNFLRIPEKKTDG